MKKTHRGSCHCGKIRFEADIDLDAGTARCNCSICAKTRYWGAMVRPDAFRLLSGATDLGDYRFGTGSVHHHFCRHCGVNPFRHGHIKEMGGEFYTVNITCLDDVEPAELSRVPVAYADGLHDNWRSPPAETGYL
jgi:hypothetical protein